MHEDNLGFLFIIDGSTLEISSDLSDGTLDQVDFFGNDALLFSLGVSIGGRGGWRGVLSIQTLDFLLGLGDILRETKLAPTFHFHQDLYIPSQSVTFAQPSTDPTWP